FRVSRLTHPRTLRELSRLTASTLASEPHAMEEAMAKQNLLPKNVPRAELDQRAHEARIQIERFERLMVPRIDAPNFLAETAGSVGHPPVQREWTKRSNRKRAD